MAVMCIGNPLLTMFSYFRISIKKPLPMWRGFEIVRYDIFINNCMIYQTIHYICIKYKTL